MSTSGASGSDMSENEARFLQGLNDLKLIGHSEQKKALKQAFERVKLGGMSEVIFLHGESGVGKSKTAHHVFRKQTSTKSGSSNKKSGRRGHFVSAKFDQHQSNSDPYSAIVAAFCDICDAIDRSQDGPYKKEIRQNLKERLCDDETVTLMKLIPSIINLMVVQDSSAATIGSTSSLHQAFIKFKLLCRKFMSAVATEEHPIVLLLDDMQWADEDSTELFKTLCSDMDSKHVLIVAAYRDDEGFVPPTNMETILPCTDVPVPRLGVDDVNSMVSSITGMSSKRESLPLAQVVHAKTQGNAQFVKLFLESLYSERLLWFSVEEGRWYYNVKQVMAETTSASNILIAAKIDRLSCDLRDVLKFAACLGYSFELEHLQVVLSAEHENLTGKDHLPGSKLPASQISREAYRSILLSIIDKAIKYGIVTIGKHKGTFCFTHDKLFEGVYSHLPGGLERQQLHVRIGRRLLDAYPLDEFVRFLAVDHINQGAPSILLVAERMDLAKLNRSMAELAITKFSAFARARDLILQGLTLFPVDYMWASDYKLALEMNTIGAQSSVVGESPERFVETVLDNARSLHDKLPLFTTLMKYYGSQDRFDEAIDVGMTVLKLLGEKLPRKVGKAHVIWEFAQAKRALGNKTDEQILALPKVEDPYKIAALRTMREIGICTYFTGPNLLMTCILRALRLTVRHGIYAEFTPAALAAYGFLHLHLKKEKESLRFIKLALLLAEKQGAKYIRAQLAITAFALGLHHWEPLEKMYQPLVDGYLAGDKYGDTSQGLVCAKISCDVKFMLGVPLGDVDKSLNQYVQIAKAYNMNGVLALACPLHQKVLNLIGGSDRPTTLTGKAMKQEALISSMKSCGNEVAMVLILDHLFQLNCLFADWNNAFQYQEEIQKHTEGLETLETFITARHSEFFLAMFSVVWYQKTSSKKHKRIAHRILHTMKQNQASGCPNYDCFIPILEVEISSRKMEKAALHSAYTRAIDSCRYIHLKAFAHERAAFTIQDRFSDRGLAKEHLLAAKRHYTDWQALAKVKDIEGNLKYL